MKKYLLPLLFIGGQVFGHGEDRPGPHNGHIKMLGSFHVEVSADPKGSFHVFLLDENFKNPTIKDSSVEIILEQGKAKNPYQCEVMGNNHFHCQSKKKLSLKSGKLIVKAQREGARGEAHYSLPLTWKENKSEAKSEDHSHH